MVRKLMLAAVAVVGVCFAGGAVEAGGGHHGHGHGHGGHYGHGGRHGHWHGHRGGYRGGVVITRPAPYPVYPSYPVYGYPSPVYGPAPIYSPYNSSFGVNTGNFSLFMAR